MNIIDLFNKHIILLLMHFIKTHFCFYRIHHQTASQLFKRCITERQEFIVQQAEGGLLLRRFVTGAARLTAGTAGQSARRRREHGDGRGRVIG